MVPSAHESRKRLLELSSTGLGCRHKAAWARPQWHWVIRGIREEDTNMLPLHLRVSLQHPFSPAPRSQDKRAYPAKPIVNLYFLFSSCYLGCLDSISTMHAMPNNSLVLISSPREGGLSEGTRQRHTR